MRSTKKVDLSFFWGGLRGVGCLSLRGLRSLRSLRPLPSSSASSLRDNLLPTGPAPFPCPGVDTPLRANSQPHCSVPSTPSHYRKPSGATHGPGKLSTRVSCTQWSFQMGIGGITLRQSALHEGVSHRMVANKRVSPNQGRHLFDIQMHQPGNLLNRTDIFASDFLRQQSSLLGS